VIVADPHELLGVGRQSSSSEIRSAHARLAAVFDATRWQDDPDLYVEASEWLRAVDGARDVLLGSAPAV
jgi:curved DNA-binding protein CbpA